MFYTAEIDQGNLVFVLKVLQYPKCVNKIILSILLVKFTLKYFFIVFLISLKSSVLCEK
jgi:hypothetical protein